MAEKTTRETAKARRKRQMMEFCGHIVGSATISDAARKAGVSPRTSTRWLRSAQFKDCFVALHRPDFEALGLLAKSLTVPALQRLGEIIRDPESPATAAAAACKIIADIAMSLDERGQLQAELDEVRSLIAAHQKEQQA